DVALAVLPHQHAIPARIALMAGGVLLNGVATGLYIGAGFGPGPGDGLMTGLAARGISIRIVRTSIEVGVLAAGWLLGGTVGAGTVAYALSIGPLVQVLLPRLTAAAHGDRHPARGGPARRDAAHGERPPHPPVPEPAARACAESQVG